MNGIIETLRKAEMLVVFVKIALLELLLIVLFSNGFIFIYDLTNWNFPDVHLILLGGVIGIGSFLLAIKVIVYLED